MKKKKKKKKKKNDDDDDDDDDDRRTMSYHCNTPCPEKRRTQFFSHNFNNVDTVS